MSAGFAGRRALGNRVNSIAARILHHAHGLAHPVAQHGAVRREDDLARAELGDAGAEARVLERQLDGTKAVFFAAAPSRRTAKRWRGRSPGTSWAHRPRGTPGPHRRRPPRNLQESGGSREARSMQKMRANAWVMRRRECS